MSWDNYEKAGKQGPWQLGKKLIWLFLAFALIITPISMFFGWFGEAAQVAREEFGPRAMLKKYEWFKDASSVLDKKRADINVYKSRIKAMPPYKDMGRVQQEQFMLWQTELAGVKSSYNDLAASYNAQMSKFNWRFANRGTLPKGATQPLPRSVKTYQEK